ncbi:hypothetical protein [Polaribacter sp. R77954]|uniref:hypothetical protein n=1 Tax=Polaribacter sp. R77954 TaxID=3093870 RepID=UPI0037C72CFF
MKKIASIILLVFVCTLNVQAQKKGGKQNVGKMLTNLSTELNLTETQKAEIKPLLVSQLADRKAMNEKRKALKESGEELSKEDRKEMRKEANAKTAAFNAKLASILDKEQMEKYLEIEKNKKMNKKKKAKIKGDNK